MVLFRFGTNTPDSDATTNDELPASLSKFVHAMAAINETKPHLTASEKPSDPRSVDGEISGGKLPGNATDDDINDAGEYVTGFKLAIIVASVALACFLMLLDTMVISTVRMRTPTMSIPGILLLAGKKVRSLTSFSCHVKAVPRITDTFNSLPDVGWYASAYQFGRYVLSLCS